MGKKEIAETFEELRAVADADRVEIVAPKRRGRARVVNLIDEDGNVISRTTHARLLEGLLDAAGIEAAVRDGVRPKVILCLGCKAFRKVPPRGRIPKWCEGCSAVPPRKRKRKGKGGRPRTAREKIQGAIAAWIEGATVSEAARSVGVSCRTVYRAIAQIRQEKRKCKRKTVN